MVAISITVPITKISAPMNVTSSRRVTGPDAANLVPRSLITARIKKARPAMTPSSTLVTNGCRRGLPGGAVTPPLDRTSRATAVNTSTGSDM